MNAVRHEDQQIKTKEGAKKWKNQSEQFRAAIRAARQITEAQAKGIDIRTLKVLHHVVGVCRCIPLLLRSPVAWRVLTFMPNGSHYSV
jgi:hypothetical protein